MALSVLVPPGHHCARGHLELCRQERVGDDDLLAVLAEGHRHSSDDQKRIVTAGMAIRNGASHVVVGRPITRAADPIQVIEQMQQDIAASSK